MFIVRTNFEILRIAKISIFYHNDMIWYCVGMSTHCANVESKVEWRRIWMEKKTREGNYAPMGKV